MKSLSVTDLRHEKRRRDREAALASTPELPRGAHAERNGSHSVADKSIDELMEAHGISRGWTSFELDQADCSISYLVDGLIVEHQHAVIAGASKTMKTSIGVDLALSLARPCKFLGQFRVPEPKRVLFLSAESGEGTVQETARRVAKSKGFELATDEHVTWGFWVPRAKNDEQLQILGHELDRSEAQVAIIDPLYHVLDGEDQSNLSLNGQQLQAISKRCLSRGVTPILVDHVKRSSANAKGHLPLELEDVTGAGKAEFFRQWLLVSRRERFDPDSPIHKLWVIAGGSAGHCGIWAVDIDESRDPESKVRTWGVTVASASEAIKDATNEQQRKQAREQERNEVAIRNRVIAKIRKCWTDPEEAKTSNNIKLDCALKSREVRPAIEHLLGTGELEAATVTAANHQSYPGFRWTEKASHITHSGPPGTTRDPLGTSRVHTHTGHPL